MRLSEGENGAEGRGSFERKLSRPAPFQAKIWPLASSEQVFFRFVRAAEDHRPDEEVEIAIDECDEIEFSGTMIDPGEAVAQSLALAIDPFAEGPGADEARRRAGIISEGAGGAVCGIGCFEGSEWGVIGLFEVLEQRGRGI